MRVNGFSIAYCTACMLMGLLTFLLFSMDSIQTMNEFDESQCQITILNQLPDLPCSQLSRCHEMRSRTCSGFNCDDFSLSISGSFFCCISEINNDEGCILDVGLCKAYFISIYFKSVNITMNRQCNLYQPNCIESSVTCYYNGRDVIWEKPTLSGSAIFGIVAFSVFGFVGICFLFCCPHRNYEFTPEIEQTHASIPMRTPAVV